MKERAVLDLRDLPMHGMGSASLTWWGTLGFMLIEGSGFALVIGVYLYLEIYRAGVADRCPVARSRAGYVRDGDAAGQRDAEHSCLAVGRATGIAQGADRHAGDGGVWCCCH